MSEYSGKCDFCDSICIRDDNSYWVNNLKTKIYVGNVGALRITDSKDLIPYYPYLVSFSCSNEDGAFVQLTTESFIDIEEKERLSWILRDVLYVYNKCKRKKEEFTLDKLKERVGKVSYDYLDYLYEECFNRVKTNKHATTDGLHDQMHNYYRQNWYDLAKENGMENHPIMRDCKYKIDEYNRFRKGDKE